MEKVGNVAGSAGSGSPVRIWHAAEEGTQEVAAALPDSFGLDHVKQFIREHAVISTCAVLLVAYAFVGESLPIIGPATRTLLGRS
jgi:hypothetical protein